MEIEQIQTVKIQGDGYLLNGTMSVPKADGNRHYELIKQWLSKGNTPEPEFTAEEIIAKENAMKIAEAKAYLNDTMWINDKYTDIVLINKLMTDEEYKDKYSLEYQKRAEARALINSLEEGN